VVHAGARHSGHNDRLALSAGVELRGQCQCHRERGGEPLLRSARPERGRRECRLEPDGRIRLRAGNTVTCLVAHASDYLMTCDSAGIYADEMDG